LQKFLVGWEVLLHILFLEHFWKVALQRRNIIATIGVPALNLQMLFSMGAEITLIICLLFLQLAI